MAAFVVFEKPGTDGAANDVSFVRDGFHWLAFLAPVVWLFWHRLWIEAVLALAATLVISAAGEWSGLGAYASLSTLLVSIYVGLEGSTLRLRALARRGWREWGVLEATRLRDAETLYAATRRDPSDDNSAGFAEPPPAVSVPATTRTVPAQAAIGMVPYPGRS